MDLESISYNQITNKKLKKCEFCNKELKPKGLDYLYENISPDSIEYERCNCEKAKEYWAKKDAEKYLKSKKEYYKSIINQLYKDSYMRKNYQNKNFENYNKELVNSLDVEIIEDYTKKMYRRKSNQWNDNNRRIRNWKNSFSISYS